jgi:hypothetical protein
MVKFKALYQEGLDYQDFLAERSPIIITSLRLENGVKNCLAKLNTQYASLLEVEDTLRKLEGSKEKTNNNVRNKMVS